MRSPIEHASSMDRHISMLMQSTMHTAIENTSSAYTRAILNMIGMSSIFRAHACRYSCNIIDVSSCVAVTHVYSQV